MKREEFYKLFGHPSSIESVEGYVEANKFREIIFVKAVYNQMLNSYRNLPLDYKIQAGAIWSKATADALEDAESKKTIEEALKKSKLAKEMVKRGIEVQAKIHIIPQYLITGDIHCWKVYVEFTFDVEALALYYGSKYKQKVFIFVEDGVFKQKHPPYRLKEEASPTGWIGMGTEGDTIITCY